MEILIIPTLTLPAVTAEQLDAIAPAARAGATVTVAADGRGRVDPAKATHRAGPEPKRRRR